MKIKEKRFDIITGQETLSERDETDAETKERLDHAQKAAAAQAEAEAKAAQKAALLNRLGITEEEAKLLLN